MNTNFTPTANTKQIELPMAFKPSVDSFHRTATIVNHPPFGSLFSLGDGLFMRWIGVYDGDGSVLSSDSMPDFITRVRGVHNNVMGVELPIGQPCFRQERCGLLAIVNVPRAGILGNGQLVSRVHQQVNLVAPGVLLLPIGVGLDYPASVGVGMLLILGLGAAFSLLITLSALLRAIRPRLDGCTIYGNGLPEIREHLKEAAGETSPDVLEGKGKCGRSQLGEEAGEGRLARELIGRFDATDLSDEGIVFQVANQRRDGFQAQVIVSDEATPEDFGVVSFGAAPFRASESGNEAFIGQFLEKGFEFPNYRWRLSGRTGYDTIELTHWEDTSFLVVGAVRYLLYLAALHLSIAQVYYKEGQKSSVWQSNMGCTGNLEEI